MKKFLKITLRVVLGLIAFVALYLLAAFGLSKIATPAEPVADRTVDIYILTNGVHTDVVVPLKTEQIDWSKEIKFENTVSKDTTATLVAFGWGDKGFYLNTPTWAQLKFSTAFKAAFALSSSATCNTWANNALKACGQRSCFWTPMDKPIFAKY